MWTDSLKRIGACEEAIAWANTQPDYETAWERCERPDWLFWLAGHVPGVDAKNVVMAACACARLALLHVPEGEDRPRRAIETAEAWCRGEASLEEVREAAASARAASAWAASARAASARAACCVEIRKHIPKPELA